MKPVQERGGVRGGLSRRARWWALGGVAAMSIGAVGVYGVQALQDHQERTTGASAAELAASLPDGPHITFRNTASGEGYGMVSSVSLADPGGARQVSGQACDRVDVAGEYLSCLRTLRGIPTTFETQVYDYGQDLGISPVTTWPLAGIPSRTRVSDDGLVATTAFVTGHSYAADSFSTETTVKGAGDPDGRDYGNLQDFEITVDGEPLTAIDRNVWGVSFAGGDRFFATVASGGTTWLMEGDLAARTMASVATEAECPSVSPDGSRVAFKVRRDSGGDMVGGSGVHWDVAVLDLASGERTVIELERGIDDQLEWLDEDTLLYGLPREEAGWDADVFALEAEAEAEPELFIEHAWSPSVVR
ncbi:TolB-like translocation protein; signal peptide [Citricoccus zhacaiensis]|uniref:TolB-like translocation protein signal peptide n=1 Tax=Citricoccus zhacaiensis TaxID=489142 RepID=A0ABQ2LRJ6_9MICC|nr:hypothetical protein [Citricoccus zhacaiensis]GGO41073.1 TolB-like translocation protein; signal peptide [Citricoccus zhacaiensis]